MSLTTEHLVGGRKTFNGLFGTKKLNLNALLFMFVMYSPWSLQNQSVGQYFKSLRSRQAVLTLWNLSLEGIKGCMETNSGVVYWSIQTNGQPGWSPACTLKALEKTSHTNLNLPAEEKNQVVLTHMWLLIVNIAVIVGYFLLTPLSAVPVRSTRLTHSCIWVLTSLWCTFHF